MFLSQKTVGGLDKIQSKTVGGLDKLGKVLSTMLGTWEVFDD